MINILSFKKHLHTLNHLGDPPFLHTSVFKLRRPFRGGFNTEARSTWRFTEAISYYRLEFHYCNRHNHLLLNFFNNIECHGGAWTFTVADAASLAVFVVNTKASLIVEIDQ